MASRWASRIASRMARRMARRTAFCLGLAGAVFAQVPAPPAGYNYAEASVPAYQLIDPLHLRQGIEVRHREAWKTARAAWISLFEDNVFGRVPSAASTFTATPAIVEANAPALAGTALRSQIDVPLASGIDAPVMHLLLYLPAHHARKVPLILGLNFAGNPSVVNDPGIHAHPVWRPAAKRGEPATLVPFDDTARGAQASEWQVPLLLRHGYGFATACYGDIEPDAKIVTGTAGVRAAFARDARDPAWGALSAWAWGLSQARAVLASRADVDASEIVVTGHSRLGKAADWAAALDPGFAAVLSTESGKGGQSLYRRKFGEDIAHLERSFPYWFTPAFARWVDRDDQIPVDGNVLLSLIAPRPLYVASAEDDLFSDPEGEFESANAVGRVYALFGRQGLGVEQRPPVNQPIMHHVAYHIRSGRHDVTLFDWEQYLTFLDREFGSPRNHASRSHKTSSGGRP